MKRTLLFTLVSLFCSPLFAQIDLGNALDCIADYETIQNSDTEFTFENTSSLGVDSIPGIGELLKLVVISYTWDFGDSTVSNDQSPTHEYSEEGLYLVKMNMASLLLEEELCSSDVIRFLQVRKTSSVNETKLVPITLLPNPTQDFIQLKNADQVVRVNIYDLNGKLVQQSPATQKIDVRTLNRGEYVLTAMDTNGKALYQSKFMIN